MSEKQRAPYLSPKGLCVVVILACVFNIGTIVGIIYQQYVWAIKSHREISSLADIPNLISMSIYLCPTFIVLIARRIFPVVISYASILFVILLGRIYYLLPPKLTGVDGLAVKFNWSDLGLTLLGTSSSAAIAVWVIVQLFVVSNSILKRLKGAQ